MEQTVATKSWADQHGSDRLQRIRFCTIEVDGTLLNSHQQVAAQTTEAVNDARRRGLVILLATSRAPSAVKPVLAQIPSLAHEVFIGSQGAITGRYNQTDSSHPPPAGNATAISSARGDRRDRPRDQGELVCR
jgi:hydroxymethylpyrimidine pyrophosphatase-like HAD family hydrolase